MNFWEILLIAIALSMDAFGSAVSCGIKLGQPFFLRYLKISFFFALFQILMPMVGHLVGVQISSMILSYSHLVVALIFFVLGGKNLLDLFVRQKNDSTPLQCNCSKHFCLLSLSVANSIDALAIGFLFSLKSVSLIFALPIIFITTFALTILGLILGHYSLKCLKNYAVIFSIIILWGLALVALLK